MFEAVGFFVACAVGGGGDACYPTAIAYANPVYSTVTPSLVPNTPMPQWTSSIELGPATSGAVPTR